jgi:vacuolar iron transporter family protein
MSHSNIVGPLDDSPSTGTNGAADILMRPSGPLIINKIRMFQRSEITERCVYRKLADSLPDSPNKVVLRKIAADEERHYSVWRRYSGRNVGPDYFKVWLYFVIAKILGLTFGVKLMEKNELNAQAAYRAIAVAVPEAEAMVEDEGEHERQLLGMIDEEHLRYVGSIVLGLNDALVELTGALAGLTLAMPHTKLVATAGLITGIAAALSMSASEYVSTKAEGGDKNPVKAAIYTGIAYIFTVLFLIAPYLICRPLFLCLALTILNSVVVICLFTFYVSVAQDLPFKRRFFEMTALSLSVAAFSFIIGLFVRKFMNIDI